MSNPQLSGNNTGSFFKDFLDEKRYSSKTYQVFGYVLQIMVCSFVLFVIIFQTCYSIYIRYKFWC